MKWVVFGAWRRVAGLALPSRARNLRRLRARGEDPGAFKIREASATDIPALTRLHVTTWNATYAPLLMKGPSYEVRERQWHQAFTKQEGGWFCFVVERPDGELVAFAQGNRSDHPEFGGQLAKIYVLRDYQRMGIGRRLLGRVATRFRSLGVNSMWLIGDARNPSSRVWTTLGATKTDPDPGTGNYGWRDLARLAAYSDSTEAGMNVSIRMIESADESIRKAILEPLIAYNHVKTGRNDSRLLVIAVESADGTVVGGLWGRTSYDWLFVELLFVPEPLRGRGLGAELMKRAEAEAITRGCQNAWLDTFKFQARAFYEHLGYTCFGELEEYPAGSARYFMRKRLIAVPTAGER